MWVMKLKLESKGQFLGRMAIKHKVSLTGYPLSYYKDKKWIYLVAAGFMFGKEGNKKAMVQDIRRQAEFVDMDVKNDFVVIVTKQPLFTEPVYDPRIIRPFPVVINHREGKHTWHLASFDKGPLMRVYSFAKKHLGAELLKLQQEKLSNITITKFLPELTKKQKTALEFAIHNGYYDYPKKVKMEKLAEIMGLSYSTYQAHLKKAEGKLIPSVYREL
ncbi:helix-turn-helix domain-containing protein [Candidatus Woesearchaeota archaeon]|nr:helix-turn-helix domain-containing protein [Candidatus Woesearchaeota archaeon]